MTANVSIAASRIMVILCLILVGLVLSLWTARQSIDYKWAMCRLIRIS